MSHARRRLRCEHREDIPCVDTPAPRLSWALEGGAAPDRLPGASWATAPCGTAAGSTSAALDRRRLRGPAAAARERVRVDRRGLGRGGGRPAAASPRASAPGRASGRAEWIGRDRVHDPAMPVPGTERGRSTRRQLLRRLLPLPVPAARRSRSQRAVRRATLYATARGVVELELNGTRVGDAVLAPGWTDYRERIEYAAHDVTALLRDGENVLGAILGDGWYAGFVGFDPRRPGNHYGARARAAVRAAPRARRRQRARSIATDERWRATTGPARVLRPADGRALRRAPRARAVAPGRPCATARRRRGSCPSARSRSA